MKLPRKKRLYYKFFLRPLLALRLSLSYFYGRIAFALAVYGIKVPGFDKIKKRMSPNVISAFERKVLVYEIKGERFSFRSGPIWVRKFIDGILLILNQNKFWILMVLKIGAAAVAIAIPILIFILLRGVLPVPERVPYGEVTTKLTPSSDLMTAWPYTESPFLSDKNQSINVNVMVSSAARGVSITPVVEPEAPLGLFHFGIGYYPTSLQLMRGFLVSEKNQLTVINQQKMNEKARDVGNLRVQYYLFPARSSSTVQCKIELKDETGALLASTMLETPKHFSERNSLTRAWRERLTPSILPDFGAVQEFRIAEKSLPKKIFISAQQISQIEEKEADKTDFRPELEKMYGKLFQTSTQKVNDLSGDECVFAVGDFSFEKKSQSPLKRRGVIFIVVDTLRADTAYDKNLMPNLNRFAEEHATQFFEHRAQGNMTVPSVIPLLTSRYSREVGPIAFSYAANLESRQNFYKKQFPLLPTTFQQLGYRVGGIGWLSLFSEALEGGLDLGFHNAIISENSEYEARQITEHMANWLQSYGNAPFFLYLHYNTMHGPYKPPLEDIDLARLLAKPFGLNQRKQLYDGLARYWDHEFPNILRKLEDLGILDQVDIVVTADHGAQFYDEPWKYLSPVDQNMTGGYADKGHSLLDEEVRVPLILRLANSSISSKDKIVSAPTAHIDLLPTLYRLAGGIHPNSSWRGVDLLSHSKKDSLISSDELLHTRDHIYFEGHRYAGILYWGNKFRYRPFKYIRQLEPDGVRLLLTHNPWNVNINWFQSEIYSTVDFTRHAETWLSDMPNEQLRELRKVYFRASPSDLMLRVTPHFSGFFSMSLNLKKYQHTLIDSLPVGLTFKISRNQVSFSGHVEKGESILVNLGGDKIQKLTFDKGVTPVICPNGNQVENAFLAELLEKQVCAFFPPPLSLMEENYSVLDRPVVIQKSLSHEKAEQIEGTGAGAALQQALREWGYAK